MVKALKQKQNFSSRAKKVPYLRQPFRDGVVYELCGRGGYNALEDGCTDAANLLRMLKQFSPNIYNRVKRRDPELIRILEQKLKLKEFNNKIALRRQRRMRNTVKSTSIKNAICLAEEGSTNGDYLYSELWAVAKTIFALKDSSDDEKSTESGYDRASSTN